MSVSCLRKGAKQIALFISVRFSDIIVFKVKAMVVKCFFSSSAKSILICGSAFFTATPTQPEPAHISITLSGSDVSNPKVDRLLSYSFI